MKSMCERIEIRKNTFNDTQIKTLGKTCNSFEFIKKVPVRCYCEKMTQQTKAEETKSTNLGAHL